MTKRDTNQDRLKREPFSPLRVRMVLRHVLYISYALPAPKIRQIIPDKLPLVTVNNDTAFVSIVALRCERVRINLIPAIRFSYNQLNIRTYVLDPISRKPAVCFLKSGITSSLISLVTRTAGIPWQKIEFNIQSQEQAVKTSDIATGNWEGEFLLKAHQAGAEVQSPPFFQDLESAVNLLIRPLTGFIVHGKIARRFTIQHAEVRPQVWVLESISFPPLESMEIVEDASRPHSVFYLPKAEFSIFLPPRKVK